MIFKSTLTASPFLSLLAAFDCFEIESKESEFRIVFISDDMSNQSEWTKKIHYSS